MASAVDRTIAYAIAGDTSFAANVAALAAVRSRAVSTYVAISIRATGVRCRLLVSLPPHTLPPANAHNAAIERAAEMPGAPPAAKPRKTTFPVMFAVKMWQ